MEKIKIKFEDVFTSDGCMEGKYNIEIDQSVPPVKLPKRRVPVTKMPIRPGEKRDHKVKRSTDLISSLVSVTKKGKDLHRPKTTESSTDKKPFSTLYH